MISDGFEALHAEVALAPAVSRRGRVASIASGTVSLSGLGNARLGDRVRLLASAGPVAGEVVALKRDLVSVLLESSGHGVSIGDPAEILPMQGIAPDASWMGRVVDPFGNALDGRPLVRGRLDRALAAAPPPAVHRRRLGPRLETGVAVFNTFLPLVRGQRIGLFSGSGVGKSTLLAKLAKGVSADVIVLALIGERGRELREFVEDTLGPEGMARTVVVAATSDQSPLVRRRCAWAAMSVAEHFRDMGQQVLLLADSVTRFAEAHREVALAAGEPPSLRGFPPSTAHTIMALAERAGPGPDPDGAGAAGDITAVFTVLVSGSDMDEPVADILRGVLDGHVVMDRSIAERGRFPAIDLLRSVSRSLPGAADARENALIARGRRLLGAYDQAALMIQAGLYVAGADPLVDAAVPIWPELDAFVGEDAPGGIKESFKRLEAMLAAAGTSKPSG